MTTPSARPPPGLDWDTYVAWLVSEHGGVAALAERLVEARRGAESIESVERALRRLRARGVLDGGTWGQRLLHRFGLPPDVEGRLRWMGSYHTRFSDLPRGVCLDHLASWDRAPIAASRGRVVQRDLRCCTPTGCCNIMFGFAARANPRPAFRLNQFKIQP